MNIFMMLLVILFMAGYYFISAPSQIIAKHETGYAVNYADLRGIVECAISSHTSVIKDTEFNNICIQKYDISNSLICLNESKSVVNCEIDKVKKPEFNFVITASGILPESEYNNVIEILEKYYPTANTFGVLMDGFIISGSNSKKQLPESVIESAKLSNGQLIYFTQFDIPDITTEYAQSDNSDITCGLGTVKTYRFSRWQCIPINEKTNCPGDTVWDSDVLKCVGDESKRPLCSDEQTAVLVDDVWECIDPFPERSCPDGETAKLNYSSLEWECVIDPNATKTTKSCDNPGRNIVFGTAGTTLQLSYNSCTDCEKMLVDSDTCATKCVPDTTKLGDSKCYSNTSDCSGNNRAFYFGFPNSNYVSNVSAVSGYNVSFDAYHSQNRMFNCLDCGTGEIDTEKSFPPYIAVCK